MSPSQATRSMSSVSDDGKSPSITGVTLPGLSATQPDARDVKARTPSPSASRVELPLSTTHTKSEGHEVHHVSGAHGETGAGAHPVAYRLYKRRFLGVLGLFLLNVVTGMSYPWFGAISNDTAATFNLSLTQVNWLSNVCGIIYIPVALSMPLFVTRYGVRVSCYLGSINLLFGAWLRYAGTAKSLSPQSSYALMFLGQVFSGGIAQAIFQTLGPKYSELWFNLNGRTTATMIMAVAGTIGSALAQLISPEVGGPRSSVLILAIVSTVISATCFLVGAKPPTPPTYAGSIQSPPMTAFLKAWVGLPCPPESRMSGRERIDFTIIAALFSVLVAAAGTFGILTNQYFSPHGYDAATSGLFGATLLLSGLIGSLITAPLFDRYFTHHFALFVKVAAPICGVLWFSLVWAIKPDNTAALFAIFAIIGFCMTPMLPVGLELAVEVTRNAEASSSLLFGIGNGAGVIVLAIEDALRAGPNANPPLNMKKGLIFQGVLVLVITFLGFGIRGTQTRRAKDEAEAMESVDGTEEMSDVQAVRTLHQNQTESFGSPTAVDSKA